MIFQLGKTTLVKEILNNTKGIKILVIENEIGVEGIDHDLLMQHTTKEEIILMNNGCICCTVRKDLLDTFHRLFKNQSFAMLDWIVIETTGIIIIIIYSCILLILIILLYQ